MLSKNIKDLLKDFIKEEQGSAIIIVAMLATTILILATGVAIDLSRGEMVQGRMNSALDAAGLAVEHAYSNLSQAQQATWTQAQANAMAQRYFDANFPSGYMGSGPITICNTTPCPIGSLQISPVNNSWNTVNLTSTSKESTAMMGALKVKNINVASTAQITTGLANEDLELALIIDNSGAMQPDPNTNYMPFVISAATGMINNLYSNNPSSAIYVSLIPYADSVVLPVQSYVNNWHGTGSLNEPLAYNPLSDFQGCMANRKITSGYQASDLPPWYGGNSATAFPRYEGPFDLSKGYISSNYMVKVTGYKAQNANRGVNNPPDTTMPYWASSIVNGQLDPPNSTLQNLATYTGATPVNNGVRLGLDQNNPNYQFGCRYPLELNFCYCNSNTDGTWVDSNSELHPDTNCNMSGILNRSDMMRIDFGAQYVSSFSNFYIHDLYATDWADWYNNSPSNCNWVDTKYRQTYSNGSLVYIWTPVGWAPNTSWSKQVYVYGCVEQGQIKAFNDSYSPIQLTVRQDYLSAAQPTPNPNPNPPPGLIHGIEQSLPNYLVAYVGATNSAGPYDGFRFIEIQALDNGSRQRIFSSTSSYRPNGTENSDIGVSGFDYKPACNPLQPASFFMTNAAQVDAQLNTMKAAGPTRNDVGAAWGWFALSQYWRGILVPSNTSLPKDYTAKNNMKVAVIMTQGTNVSSTYDGYFLNICSGMKNKGITIYTVAYNASQAVQNLLAQCASPGDALTANNASQLQTVFNNIGTGIASSKLRVSK